MNYPSFRQSVGWQSFLTSLNWETIKTKSGIKLYFLKTFLGYLCKIQRPGILTERELSEIEKIAISKKTAFVKLEPNFAQNEEILLAAGYKTSEFPLSPTKTMLLDLRKSEKELWSELSHSGKYSVNRARREKSKVEIVKNPTKEQITRFYKLHAYTGKSRKFYIEPLSHIQAIVEGFNDNCYLAWVFDKDNNLESAKLYVDYKGVVTYLRGGTSPVGRKHKGGYLLMWESMLYFKNLGFDIIDLEGLDDDRFYRFTREWGGFSHFKEKFGGEVVVFPPPYLKLYNPLLRFLSKIMPIPF